MNLSLARHACGRVVRRYRGRSCFGYESTPGPRGSSAHVGETATDNGEFDRVLGLCPEAGGGLLGRVVCGVLWDRDTTGWFLRTQPIAGRADLL